MSELEKLTTIVQEDDAKSLLKLYSKIVEYKDFLTKQGYDEDFNSLTKSLVDSINEVMEVK